MRVVGAFTGARAVVIGIPRDAASDSRFDETIDNRIVHAIVGNTDRPRIPAHAVAAAAVRFESAEVGRDIRRAPAARAELRPAVVVPGVAAHVDHAVDGAAATEPLARGPLVRATTNGWVGLSGITPVVLGVVNDGDGQCGHTKSDVRVGLAGLEERDLDAPIRQACRHRATRRSPSNDDDVGLFGSCVFCHAGADSRMSGAKCCSLWDKSDAMTCVIPCVMSAQSNSFVRHALVHGRMER